MEIAEKKVAEIHYTLKDDKGEILDSTEGQEPMTYLCGSGILIPGLEEALNGKVAGDKLEASFSPAEAFGELDENLKQTVALENFGEAADQVAEGVRFQMPIDDNVVIATVTGVEGNDVHVDLNHPLAGVALTFNVEVISVREATEDELSHGHVHGAGCSH